MPTVVASNNGAYPIDIQQFRSDPVFKEMLNQAVAEQIRQERISEGPAKKRTAIDSVNAGKNSKDESIRTVQSKVAGQVERLLETPKRNVTEKLNVNDEHSQTMKSPSDTTIYALAIAKNCFGSQNNDKSVDIDLINKISDFVARMRIEGSSPVRSARQDNQPQPGCSSDVNSGAEWKEDGVTGGASEPSQHDEPNSNKAKAVADQIILDAERFRIAVEKPKGMVCAGDVMVQNQYNYPKSTVDDEFFHITCHIDDNLKSKIERGEFVELEKLLPKDPTRRMIDESRMELVNRDGATYFVPMASDNDQRISNIRKWEQAFRVYATVHTRANPSRAGEIWQYIYTINLAANAYAWENVASYDYTFRQLMSQYPGRSWSTIYQQMWSLTMHDPISRQGGGSNPGFSNRRNRNGNGTNRDNYCWKFNRNKCKFGTRCKFDHICFYCDTYGHGSFNCPKKNRSKEGREKRNEKFDENRDRKSRDGGRDKN